MSWNSCVCSVILQPRIHNVYIDVVQKFVKSYNHSYYKSIKMKPVQVSNDNVLQVFKNLYGTRPLRQNKLNINFKEWDVDHVLQTRPLDAPPWRTQASKAHLIASSSWSPTRSTAESGEPQHGWSFLCGRHWERTAPTSPSYASTSTTNGLARSR